ncbi:PREDICTED: dehydrodolichyl diphosphate synthase 8-like [Populus euphratica]|uniref:Dehydrodolichyl diphosphate synthase 8-like n=1 Tax=Populus euphratica TaxID=75702 RepID=A0AAJ6UHS3_POPEU|nr:PREDICTED: dehydrodolichyl diphosphate synthase 8-like [Populus euphratica]
MKNVSKDKAIEILGKLVSFLRESMIHIISVGPMPNHIAFIMDGNRRLAAENAMLATAHNSKLFLTVCIACTSTDVIVHAVQESCREKGGGIIVLNESGEPEENEKNDGESFVEVTDVDKNMYMATAPEPDILIRTSGDTRLSYFLLGRLHALVFSFCLLA